MKSQRPRVPTRDHDDHTRQLSIRRRSDGVGSALSDPGHVYTRHTMSMPNLTEKTPRECSHHVWHQEEAEVEEQVRRARW
jgi:hypothetical protein